MGVKFIFQNLFRHITGKTIMAIITSVTGLIKQQEKWDIKKRFIYEVD